jgi:hypothetical protein
MENNLIAGLNRVQGSQAFLLSSHEAVGRVVSVSGSYATVGLSAAVRGVADDQQATVGKFLGILSGSSMIIGLITEIGEQSSSAINREQAGVARLDMVGEIRKEPSGATRFQRGVTKYPSMGDATVLLGDRELRVVYGSSSANTINIGSLQQDSSIDIHVNVDDLLNKHFAILGTTGVGKSSALVIILQQILDIRQNLRIFMLDPHNEYSRCFGDRAQVLSPNNLRLPFWLFNFEEIIDAFFGGGPGMDEEVEILAEVIPLAKSAYVKKRVPGARALRPIRQCLTESRTCSTCSMNGWESSKTARCGRSIKSSWGVFRPSAIIRATPSCSKMPTLAATRWRIS